jgi:hypothetical protein
MRSYDGLELDAIHELVSGSYDVVLGGLDQRRRPDERADGSLFDVHGEKRGRHGVAIREMLAVWRVGLENLYALARRVAAPGPNRDALLLEFRELALAWADFAMLHAAEGHRRGELSRAREQLHARPLSCAESCPAPRPKARYAAHSLRSDSTRNASTTSSERARSRRSTWRRSSAISAPTIACDAATGY